MDNPVPMSKRVYATLSDDLHEAAEILRFRRRYRDLAEVIRNFFRYDCLIQRDHHLTNDWAAMSAAEQDAFDAGLLRKVKEEKAAPSSWLEKLIDDRIKLAIEGGRIPTTKEIAAEVAREVVNKVSKDRKS